MFNSKLIGLNNSGAGPLPPATADGEYMVAGTNTGVLYISNTFGASWIERYTFPSASGFSNLKVSNDGQKILVRQGGSTYISLDTGVTFNQITINGSGISESDMSGNGNYIHATNSSGNIYRSTNNGASWTQGQSVNLNLFSTNYWGDMIQGKNIYADLNLFSNTYGSSFVNSFLSGIQSRFYMNPPGEGVYVRKDGLFYAKKTYNGAWAQGGGQALTTNVYGNFAGDKGLFADGTNTYAWYNTNFAKSGASDNATVFAGDAYGNYNARVKPDGVYVLSYITANPNLYTKTLSLSGITSLDVSKLV